MTPTEKFIAKIGERLKLGGGKIPAPVYFEVGKLCGLTCKQVVEAKKEHFSGAVRTPSVKAAKAPAPKKATKTTKPAAKKGKKVDEPELTAAEKKSLKKALKNVDERTGVVEDSLDTGGSFVWIASAEEIADTNPNFAL